MNSTVLKERLFPVVREAGKMMMQAHCTNESEISEKAGTANFVTIYDVRIQEFLMKAIQQLFPDAVFIAEEKENDSAMLMSEHCFIIDPIDGTTNFIHDYRHSCISVAMFTHGEPVFGVVYNPYMDELFHAAKGEGAYLNDTPIHVSNRTFGTALIAFGTAPYQKDTFAKKTFTACHKLLFSCADLRRGGSAALDLSYVACGRVEFFFEYQISPWDGAAGYLLVTEAGGVVTDVYGNPYSFEGPCPVLASNGICHEEAIKVFKSIE